MESLLGWGPDIVVIAPGFRQSGYEWATLRARGIRVWSEIELAWHLRAQADDGTYAPWLCVTGTNGKTTTVGMVESIVQAAGLRALAVGNVGVPAVTAVSDTSANASVRLRTFFVPVGCHLLDGTNISDRAELGRRSFRMAQHARRVRECEGNDL